MKRGKADYTEIRIEDKETSRVVLRGSPHLQGLLLAQRRGAMMS